MVLIVETWKVLREHIEATPKAEVLYKVDYQGDKVRLRIKAGNLAFEKAYGSKEDEFEMIIRYLDECSAYVTKGVKDADVFFM